MKKRTSDLFSLLTYNSYWGRGGKQQEVYLTVALVHYYDSLWHA